MTQVNTTQDSSKLNTFLALMLVSLVGNACADYALIWYSINKFQASNNGADHTLSLFYVGQAAGSILLSPFLAVLFDRLPRVRGALLLDTLYASSLLLSIAAFSANLLNEQVVLGLGLMTAGLGMVHKSSIAFAATQRAAQSSGVTSAVSKLMMALTTSALIGSALSGIVYRYFGFAGCMWIGILSFIPIMAYYPRLFRGDTVPPATVQIGNSIFQRVYEDFRLGWNTLVADKILLRTALVIGFVNTVSAIFPAIVGVSFHNVFGDRSDLFTMSIAVGILLGTVLTKPLGEFAKKLRVRDFVPASVVGSLVILMIGLYIQSPWIYAVAFALWCCGSAIRNVSSGSLRVKRVPKELTGRVNTIYSVFLNLGQIAGAFFVIPALQKDLFSGTVVINSVLICGAIASLLFLPKTNLNTLLDEKV